jgi:hypothetical protein
VSGRSNTVQFEASGYRALMLWILKGLLVLAKTRRGRKLLIATGVGVVDLAQSDHARQLYAKARMRAGHVAAKQASTRA